MTRCRRFPAIALLFVAALAGSPWPARAQVTTATLYGVVQDCSGAVLPGVTVASLIRARI